MRKYYLFATFTVLVVAITSFFRNERIHVTNYSSESPGATYGAIDDLKTKYVQSLNEELRTEKELNPILLTKTIEKYNKEIVPQLRSTDDFIDSFIPLLPKNYRRHFSLVHRSFSVQKASPLSPRVILYGPDAKVMMTFNAGVDENKSHQEGGDTIEVIEWNSERIRWDFSEIKFIDKIAIQERNPAKCIMCHAGTPKPVSYNNFEKYTDKLKPIFPQYPFWPGFYGSVNDIVAADIPGTKDTIMLEWENTFAHIRTLTFADTEELHRLRKIFDTNQKYLDLIKKEQSIHLQYFPKFAESMKSRLRYRHLLTLKDLYTEKNLPVPEFLLSAPYRRTFDKEYGHYLLRPNFYISTLMTYYQAQLIAEEIKRLPFFKEIQYSLLARKFNCGPIEVEGLKINELDPTFDLLYPNQTTQESRDRQYLLAYQYNVVNSKSGGPAALPLHAWNLELNEDIASYHYGNVFADLNEVVLWNLARSLFPELHPKVSRSAAEEKHYLLPKSNFIRTQFDEAGGFISRMKTSHYNFANQLQTYNDSNVRFKAQPVSAACESHLIEAAKAEMVQLTKQKNANTLPHNRYTLDPRLTRLDDILDSQFKPGLHLVKHACEACHVSQNQAPGKQIKPFLNVDWMSSGYHQDLHKLNKSTFHLTSAPMELRTLIENALNPQTLPVPFEYQMPFGRRPYEPFALECERHLLNKNYQSNSTMQFKQIFNCDNTDPTLDSNSFECRCRRLILRTDKIYKDFFKE